MDQQAIVDVVCKTGIKNLATEIGVLLGQELICADVQLQLTSKKSLFSDLERPTTALTRMTVSGDKEGDCYLLTRIDSAIFLGGTLIMLPEDMIDEHMQSGNLDGELNDAFGEVANIIAGVFTQAFVDKYPKSLRFIKKTVEDLVPTKIDVASAEPFPPGTYYVASCTLAAGDKNLGAVEFVVPATVFDLDDVAVEEPDVEAEAPTAASPEPAPAKPATAEPPPPPEEKPEVVAEAPEVPAAEAAPAAPAKPLFADAKKLTDVVFNATISQIGEEIGALLGQDLVCDDIQLLMTNKADFFANHCVDKVTMANMKVSGDREGCGFMFTQLSDAIILGGTLIMLPEDQIEEQQAKKQFEGEVEDAFGEVANILAGGLTQVFLDRYPKQLRFVRTESETIIPTKIDLASELPFPEADYYLASFAIQMEGYELNRILLLFPAHIFDLDTVQQKPAATTQATQPVAGTAAGEETAAAAASGQSATTPATAAQSTATTKPAATAQTSAGSPLVLIISEETGAAEPFTEILSSAEYECKVLNFQEDIKNLFQEHQVLGAFLIMSQVNEKGFATAIKLQSAGLPLPPMIFAGPEWTRTTVLRAVKYGAHDILIMPASGDEIQEKISRHFRKAS